MQNIYKIIWTEEALSNLKSVIFYLEKHWSEREIKKFSLLLDRYLDLIKSNPFLFVEYSSDKKIRKSVLTKQISIFYRVVDNDIQIVTFFDTRQSPEKLKKI
jgi:plasmid stabilization system protein ParE